MSKDPYLVLFYYTIYFFVNDFLDCSDFPKLKKLEQIKREDTR